MAYTEIKKRNRKTYYYRVVSIRRNNKVSKKRKYLGVDLIKKELRLREKKADEEFDLTLKDKNKRVIGSIKQKIIKILIQNKIKRAGVFGSYARGEGRKNSDIDILIEPPKNMGFAFAGLEIQLSKALKKKVDLVSYNGISPYLKEKILKQEIRIL